MSSLFLVVRPEPLKGYEYDSYDSFIVIAETEQEARNTHPSGDNKDWKLAKWDWTEKRESLKVTFLGPYKGSIAITDFENKVICASFNAG